MMKVLKIVTTDWYNASRDKRELSVVRELGAEPIVMAKGDPRDNFKEDMVDEFKVYRFSTRPLGDRPSLVKLNRLLSIFIWASKARKFNANVISGHDISGLLIGYLSSLFLPISKKPELIYDSHEFEIGRSATRSKFQTWVIIHLERFLMKRCAFSIMVNDSIADEVQHIHKLSERPIVVRNIPNYWILNEQVIADKRREICNILNVPEDTFLVMYHGALFPNVRGIENMLHAVAYTEGTAAVILGDGTDDYVHALNILCGELGIKNRTLFHKAVPHIELWKYVGAVNCGCSIAPAFIANAYYSLPNKYFENIQSMTPVICSDYPEMSKLTNNYNIGITVDPNNVREIANAIARMQCDKNLYASFKNNLKHAKEDLCWEKEKNALKDAYENIFHRSQY
jgi:glycosyltransferase involved in cell wall biosynthesis